MNQPAQPVPQAPAFPRGVREKMELTRQAVAAEDMDLHDAVHPALWEHLGPLRTLQRQGAPRTVL